MRLVRYGAVGEERPGILDANGDLRDLSGVIADIGGINLTRAGLEAIARLDTERLPRVSGQVRWGPPMAQIGKMICVGLNFRDHAAESGMPLPERPIIFMKATSAICGPFDTISLPPGSEKTDWEVELGVVIGDTARHVTVEDALEHVVGYVLINDLSERAYQLEHGGQWVKGKSYDNFGPLGPFLATRSEIADPQALAMWLEVNGRRFQNGSTADMIFTVAELVSHISQYMTLQPGDVISTGTPAGVGLGQSPPLYLKPGDVVRLGIDGLGVQEQRVIASDV